MDYPAAVTGQHLAVPFPTGIEPLLAQGADFLTTAFHASGALSKNNAVVAILKSTEFFGGGMGRKLCLDIAYAHHEPGLHDRLFVKFPRDFGDPLRALFGPLMEPEVRFALLSRQQDFPIAVPKCYFTDYDPATISGILITERIAYGEGGIEPCHDKCLDHALPEPLAHYEALTRTMARLAAYHRSGRFGADIEQQFPFDPAVIDPGSRIPYTPEQLDEKLAKLRAFATAAPHLFEPDLMEGGFIERFIAEAPRVLDKEVAIRTWLNGQEDSIALCHWNMNVDNAWFWHDEKGRLNAGLLDWGSVSQMHVAQAFYGMTCAAETGFLNAHRRGLMALFLAEYRAHGGPAINMDRFAMAVNLSIAVLGIAWMLDAPSLVEAELPDYRELEGRHDPRLRNNFLARAQLHLLTVFLNEWRAEDIGAVIDRFASNDQDKLASAALV